MLATGMARFFLGMDEALTLLGARESRPSTLECWIAFHQLRKQCPHTQLPAGVPVAVHMHFLHAMQLSSGGEAIEDLVPRFLELAGGRFQQLMSGTNPLVKILLLVKTVVSPKQVEKTLSTEVNTTSENGASQGLLVIVVALASLADLGLSLESDETGWLVSTSP